MKAFISHITEEADRARTLKRELERALPGVELFASDIGLGETWLTTLSGALGDAQAILVLCSPRSVERSWVNFESGAGWGRNARVIPVCHDGLRKEDLPFPLSIFQAVDLESLNACAKLVAQTADALHVAVAPTFDKAAMMRALAEPPPVRQAQIGIVLTHGQDKWDRSKSSPFEFPASLPSGIDPNWAFRAIHRDDDLLSSELHRMSGLILGAPWRARMGRRVIDSLVRWVEEGGRLLMLGYELGDRHHGGNLGDLAVRFGVHLETDVVGPAAWAAAKPYGVPVDFEVSAAEPLALTDKLESIRLANVQTVRVDPGGTEWLRVGQNVVCRPGRDSVEYQEGTLTQPGEQIVEFNHRAEWVPVAVEAPAGLCGSGAVLVVGSWEIIGKNGAFSNRHDNRELLTRLLNWLAHLP